MDPPVPASGRLFRRAASFSFRQERALKDINGRVNLNKSQELVSTTKAAVDGQRGTHPSKHYSTVASRYAAPVVPKKQLSPTHDGPSKGNTKMTKLPFITGRAFTHTERKPSLGNAKESQPFIVFAATAQDSILANKVNSIGAKRPRVAGGGSRTHNKSEGQVQPSRFLSFEGQRRYSSKNSLSGIQRNAALPGGVSLLRSAAHWVSLIKLAETEREEKAVMDLFRLAISLRAKPIEDIMTKLDRYHKLQPNDQIVIELVQQCESIQQEPTVSKLGTSGVASTKLESEVPVVPLVSKITVVPSIVSQKISPERNVPSKPPLAAMGRRLSRSSTFSCVDSKSQASKVICGRKLAKTLEDLPELRESQTRTASGNILPTSTGESAEVATDIPATARDSPNANCLEKTSANLDIGQRDVHQHVASQHFEEDSSSELGEGVPPVTHNPTAAMESPPTREVSMVNENAEKPRDSIFELLDGDLSKEGLGATLKNMDVENLMKGVVSSIMPESDMQIVEQLMAEENKETIGISQKNGVSGESALVSDQGRVEGKVEIIPVLVEVGDAASMLSNIQAAGVDLKAHDKTEAVDVPQKVACEDQGTGEETFGTPANSKCKTTPNQVNKNHRASSPKVYTRQKSRKGETVPLSTEKNTSPGFATPRDSSVTAHKKRGSGVSKMTASLPVEATDESVDTAASPSQSNGEDISPNMQPSSTVRSKRLSRGAREVTPRFHLPKPSWKAIVEREMRGSKLKELLAGELPTETSPLAQFVEAEMQNQKKEPEVASIVTKVKDARKTMTRSASKRQVRSPTPKPSQEHTDGEAHIESAQKPKLPLEGQEVVESNMQSCSTPGSAIRQSARIRSKMQSRTNMMQKEAFST